MGHFQVSLSVFLGVVKVRRAFSEEIGGTSLSAGPFSQRKDVCLCGHQLIMFSSWALLLSHPMNTTESSLEPSISNILTPRPQLGSTDISPKSRPSKSELNQNHVNLPYKNREILRQQDFNMTCISSTRVCHCQSRYRLGSQNPFPFLLPSEFELRCQLHQNADVYSLVKGSHICIEELGL